MVRDVGIEEEDPLTLAEALRSADGDVSGSPEMIGGGIAVERDRLRPWTPLGAGAPGWAGLQGSAGPGGGQSNTVPAGARARREAHTDL